MSKLVKCDRVELKSAYNLYIKRDKDNEVKKPASDYQKIKEEADAIIEKANRHAAEIHKQTQEKAENILKDAYDEGFSKGYEEGKSDADMKAQNLLENIAALFEKIDSKKNEILEENKNNIIKLALKIAYKVIDKELIQDDKTYINLFKRAVEEIYGQKRVKLAVSDYEAEFVTMSSDYLLSMIKDAQQIDITVLDEAPRGTCIIETESEIVEASASKQLDIIKNTLLNTKKPG